MSRTERNHIVGVRHCSVGIETYVRQRPVEALISASVRYFPAAMTSGA